MFSKGILKGINFKELVNSPTYNLIETMETKEFIIYHVDLYRIDSLTQILELELHEEPILEKPYIFLIEWPKNGKDSILPPDLIIKFSLYDDNLNERVLEIKKITEKGRKIDNSWIK